MQIDTIPIQIDQGKINSDMMDLIEKLYPICRSITGEGLRQTLAIIDQLLPLQITEVKTGTKVFDWEVPQEWNIRDGWIKNEKNEKILDFKELNLTVLNYSTPIDKIVTLEELKQHLYTLPEHPDWIPYRTSYYQRKWGFCMKHRQYENLKDELYHVKIDSTLSNGSLTYGEHFVQGETNQEIIFSCHICHPSLCNENLSGIAVATYLAKHISNSQPKYSYRFIFIPATIGSITWLSKNENRLKNIKMGIVLTLLGDSSSFNYKKTKQGNTDVDQIMEFLLKHKKGAKLLNFSPYGFDERQFNSPGLNLPVGRLTRNPNGEFPEYHTSADNFDLINKTNLKESLDLLLNFIDITEHNAIWYNQFPKGEPYLADHGLYKKTGGAQQQEEYNMALLWILSYSDGTNSVLDIAIKSKLSFQILHKATIDLENAGLLKKV